MGLEKEKPKYNHIKALLSKNKAENNMIDKGLEEYFNILCPELKSDKFDSYFSIFMGETKERIAQRWSLGKADLPYFNVENVEDIYVSISTYVAPGCHQNKHLHKLNAIIADLDYYNVDSLKELEAWQVVGLLEEDVDYPVPTFYVSTGRGLNLIWVLKGTYGTKKTKKYFNKIMLSVANRFKDYGFDTKCKDATRVIRPLKSKNSKNGKTVELLEYHDISYKLEEIGGHFLHPDGKMLHDKYKNKNKNSNTNVVVINNELNIHYRRTEDLETLVKLRSNVKMKGCREQLLFIYRLQVLLSKPSIDEKTIKESLEKTLTLNNQILDKLTEREVTVKTKSAVKNAELCFKLRTQYSNSEDLQKEFTLKKYLADNGVYLYNNSTIINTLNINDTEMDTLNFLTKDAKRIQVSRTITNKKYYRKTLKNDNKLTKKEQIQNIKEMVIKFKTNTNKSNYEIYSQLGISRATLNRYIKELKQDGLL